MNDQIQSALTPIYGQLSTNHLIKLFREDHGLLENDKWQAFLQGVKLQDITGISTSPVGSLNDIQYFLFEYFEELHNPATALYLPGTTGNYVSTPDHADLDITGDLCLIAHLRLIDWTPSTAAGIISKYVSAGTRSYYFNINTTGGPYVGLSTDGTAVVTKFGDTPVPFSNGEDGWIAVTINVDNGSSGYDIKFWIMANNGSWSQLGSTITTAGIFSIYSGSSIVELGTRGGGTSDFLNGNLYYAAVYDGIGDNSAPGLGTLVAEFDASAPVGPRYRDRTGKIWTINGSAWSWE